DHHSYVVRLKAAINALGHNPEKLHAILIQMVSLEIGGEAKKLGKRSGEFITLKSIVDEIGPELVRFFFLLRSADSQMVFDLELAKQQTMDNPYWYIQYAHARCCSLLAKAEEKSSKWGGAAGAKLDLLAAPEERAIIFQIGRLPGVIIEAAQKDEPLGVTTYLRDLATAFHSYFSAGNKDEKLRCILPDQPELTQARLTLIVALRQTLANGLRLLGLTPIERL
ncbi:arginine--tRNA ligase, partial [Candidatus Sumerlaeota bacterium]|nr:arginine--tRNA ligase [Candidatus Sumerlaeota bacterium]